jgi:hypothetical protein
VNSIIWSKKSNIYINIYYTVIAGKFSRLCKIELCFSKNHNLNFTDNYCQQKGRQSFTKILQWSWNNALILVCHVLFWWWYLHSSSWQVPINSYGHKIAWGFLWPSKPSQNFASFLKKAKKTKQAYASISISWATEQIVITRARILMT